MTTLILTITGMHCESCSRAIREALENLPGAQVRTVGVGEAELELDDGASTKADVFEAVRAAGDFDIGGFSTSN